MRPFGIRHTIAVFALDLLAVIPPLQRAVLEWIERSAK